MGNTCRFKGCKHPYQWISSGQSYIQYSARCYMHVDCYLHSGKPLSTLTQWQLGQLPYFLLKELGKLDEVKRLMEPSTGPMPGIDDNANGDH
jgi:hypothetical protein